MTNKELISNIYKQLIQFDIKKKNQPDLKMGRRTEQSFFHNEEMQMARDV